MNTPENKDKQNTAKDPKEVILHSFTEDLAEEIKKKQGKAYREALEEEREREEIEETESPMSFKNIILITLSVIFIITAIVLVVIASNKQKQVVIQFPQQTTNPLSSNKKITDISNLLPNDILSSIKTEQSEAIDADSVKSISFIQDQDVFDEKTGETVKQKVNVSIKDLFFVLNIKTPELFIKALSPDFTLGVYGCSPSTTCEKTDSNQTFLVLGLQYFNNAFRSAREWEGKMLFYLYDFMGTKVTPEDTELFDASFKDIVVKNINARILEDKNGKTILIYGFWNENKMIIATDKNVFAEVIKKLQ